MKKSIVTVLLCFCLIMGISSPALAARQPLSVDGWDGYASLERSGLTVTGKTYFPTNNSYQVTRNVKVTLNYKSASGASSVKTDSDTGKTTPYAAGGKPTASISLAMDSSKCTFTSANSTHSVNTIKGNTSCPLKISK